MTQNDKDAQITQLQQEVERLRLELARIQKQLDERASYTETLEFDAIDRTSLPSLDNQATTEISVEILEPYVNAMHLTEVSFTESADDVFIGQVLREAQRVQVTTDPSIPALPVKSTITRTKKTAEQWLDVLTCGWLVINDQGNIVEHHEIVPTPDTALQHHLIGQNVFHALSAVGEVETFQAQFETFVQQQNSPMMCVQFNLELEDHHKRILLGISQNHQANTYNILLL